jgi:hypothetical protein
VPTLAEPDARPEIAQAVPEPVAPVPAAQLAEAPQPTVPEPEPEPPAVAQAAVTVQEPAPEPSAQPSPQPPVYRSAIDQAVGAPAEVLADASALQRAEADKPGDPEPVRIERPKRVRQAKAQPAANSGSAPQSREIAPAPEAATAIDAALPPEPGALNFAWNRSGKSALLPMRVYDDGRATYLVWGAKQTIPQVEVIGAQGEQVSPAMTRHENSIVILTVPSRIVFRADKASATLENLRPVRGTVLLSGPLPGGQAASAGTSP